MMRTRLVPAGLALVLAAAASANPLVGSWASGQHRLEVRADGTLDFDGVPHRYQVQGNLLGVEGPEGAALYQWQRQGESLVVAGGELGVMTFQRSAASAPAPGSSEAPGAPPPAPAGPVVSAPPTGSPPAAAAPGEFVAEPYGFRVRPGPGWRWKVTDEAVVFGHEKLAGSVFATVFDEPLSEAEIEEVARKGYREPGVELKPKTPGKVQRVATGQGKGYYFRVTGTLKGEEVEGFSGAFLPPNAQPILLLAVATPEKWPALEGAARQLLDAVRLFPGYSPAVMEWDKSLRGYKVEYMWSYSSSGGGGFGSTSVNKAWHLCPDGSYWYTGSSNLHVDTGNDFSGGGGGAWVTGSSRGRGSEQGMWRVVPHGEGAAIVFRKVGGGAYRYVLGKRRKRGTSFMQKHFGDMGVYAAEYAQCQ